MTGKQGRNIGTEILEYEDYVKRKQVQEGVDWMKIKELRDSSNLWI